MIFSTMLWISWNLTVALSKDAQKEPVQISLGNFYSIEAYIAFKGGTLTGLKVPPPVKKRGRPKGSDLTTIDLPTKRSKRKSKSKPCSFSHLHTSEKEKGEQQLPCTYTHTHIHTLMHTDTLTHIVCTYTQMQYWFISPVNILSWFVDKEVINDAIREGKLIEEDRVECRPEKIPNHVCPG